jgi:hypothetical protein
MQLTAYVHASLHLMNPEAGGAEARRRGSAGRRAPWRAIAVSTALHLLFALSIFASASGVISGGMPDASYGDAVEVTLSGFEGAPAPSAASNQQSELESLFQRIRATQSDLNAQSKPAEQQSDLAALLSEIDREHARTATNGAGQSQADAAGRKGAGSDRAGDEAQGGEAQAAARNGERSQDVSSGGLWGQIEPCWRRMPENSAVPVTLEVTLNDRGALAVPPRILRPMAAALTDQRLVAEARAVAAVAACAPLQAPLSAGRRTFRVVFMPTSDRGSKRD